MTVTEAPRIVTSRLGFEDSHTLERYLANGGYEGLKKALTMTPEEVASEVDTASLLGRGGAGFPAGRKWSMLRKAPTTYLVINGDESEPATFKDHMLIERDPHQIIEGVVIAAYAIGAAQAFIYVRGEFALGLERMQQALNEAYSHGAVGRRILGSEFSIDVVVHPGAGAYICGEETALLESLEGKRGFPRIKPPYFPAAIGLYGEPTVVNNVETMSNLPWIVINGGAAFAALGAGRSTGTRLFALAGHVANPGVYEIEMVKTTFRDLIFDPALGGGIPSGRTLKAIIPGGVSAPWFGPDKLDLPLGQDEVGDAGSMLGSGSVVAMDDSTCMVRAAWRITRFFHRESCGQCTPCREGAGWLENILARLENGEGREADIDLLMDLCDNLAPGVTWPPQQTTICVLGPSIPSSVASGIRMFRDEFLEHVKQGGARVADPTVTSHHAIAPKVADGASVNITLDGKEIPVKAGQFLIAAAEDAGVFIPRFCYHPRMKPVGMCRMCLVEVSGPRGATLQPACYIPVADGMVVDTTTERVRKAQDGVLEFLLVNHPLDCPVCDKGGECPLQDQTLAYGPGESRFLEEKRHFAKPIALSPLVLLDRERCIQCGRCTRFAAEIAGEPMIDFAGRGDALEVAIADGHVFSSAFSGNTVQICPVGALTSTPYRFTARPWDLDQVESTCTTCSVGCRAAVQSSANRVTRLLGMDSDPVNQSWLCDKGRYGYEAVNSENRIVEPLVRSAAGVLEPSGWSDAISVAADRLAAVKKKHGAEAIGVIGGARLTNEDAYAWAKLAKGVIGTDSVDAQLGDGLPAELVLGLPRATIDETCSAKCVIVIAGDLYDELPVLYLRLRVAAEESGLPIIEMTPRTTHLSAGAAVATLQTAPGAAGSLAAALVARNRPDDVPAGDWDASLAALSSVGDDGAGLVVVVGRGSVAESADVVTQAAVTLADAYPSARFLPALRRGNVMGALDMGLAPGLLPGRVSLEGAREWYSSHDGWSALAAERGGDTAGVLAGLADGSMKAVVLVGADPVGDFPDVELATKALSEAELVVSVDCVRTQSVEHSHVVLPAAMQHERPGTTTNIEGRVVRVGQKLTSPVMCWPDWMIASEIAARLGSDLGVGSAAELWDEIERLAPSHSGLTHAVLDSPGARDGVVVPLKSTPVVIGRGTNGRGAGSVVAALFDPIATPGIESVELQGAISRVGFAEQQGGSGPPLGPGGSGTQLGTGESDATSRPTKPALIEREMTHYADTIVAEPAAGTLRLISPRRLYDHGVQMRESPSLAALVGPLVCKVNPAELETRNIASGSAVRLSADASDGHGAATLEIEVVADAGVSTGVVEVDTNVRAGTTSAAQLIGSTSVVVDLRMEPA